MTSLRPTDFLELVSDSFGRLPESIETEGLLETLDGLSNDSDFDLFLWTLAHGMKLDTEELLRKLGEHWSQTAEELSRTEETDNALDRIDWLVTRSETLARVPLPGMGQFKVMVTSRGQLSISMRCLGARRCCSFLEGVARGIAKRQGESLRYLRRPVSASEAYLQFSLIERG